MRPHHRRAPPAVEPPRRLLDTRRPLGPRRRLWDHRQRRRILQRHPALARPARRDHREADAARTSTQPGQPDRGGQPGDTIKRKKPAGRRGWRGASALVGGRADAPRAHRLWAVMMPVGQLLPGWCPAWHMTWSMRRYSAASTGSSTLELMDRATVVCPLLLTAPMVLYPGTSPSCDQ